MNLTCKPKAGTVYLVGAGPGDPGLITVRGRELILGCDCLIHDCLVHPALIDLAPPAAERIPMGKRGHRPSPTQGDINLTLIERARAGRRVVRLKGGDPFVFGRGGEEAFALAEAGIPFEVVPGVSSGLAVPAFAGIPVTHRELAGSVAFVTACRRKGKGPDWNALARVDTLVVFMAAKGLAEHCSGLITGGRNAETPACIIEWGTYAHQRVVEGTLADLPVLSAQAGIASPAVLVVGDVVRLRSRLRWFDPVDGVTVSRSIAMPDWQDGE